MNFPCLKSYNNITARVLSRLVPVNMLSRCLKTLCRRQKGVLDQLDSQVSVAERRRQEAEAEAKQLEDVKVMMAQ